MSSGRFPLCLALGALLACGPAWAQEPAGGEPSSWTDPPVRPAPQEPTKAAAPEPKQQDVKPQDVRRQEPEAPVRTERAQEPSRAAPTQAASEQVKPTPPEPDQATRRAADRRREQIRRAVERSTAEREAEAAARAARTPRRIVERVSPRRRLVERPQRLAERPAPRLRERQATLHQSLRRPVYGYAEPEPVGPAYGRPYGGPMRPDAWGDEPDFRERRIARARAAGYLVMRSRTYAYPDGTMVRRFSPMGGFEADD